MTVGTLFSIPYANRVYLRAECQKGYTILVDFDDPDCTEFGEPFYSDYCKYYGNGFTPYHKQLLDVLKKPIGWFRRTQMLTSVFLLVGVRNIHLVRCIQYIHTVCTDGSPFSCSTRSDHQATNFFSPFPDPWTGFPEEITPSMNEGDIIFFPAQLMHQLATSVKTG